MTLRPETRIMELQCARCEALLAKLELRLAGSWYRRRDVPPPLTTLLCDRCGCVLPLVDSSEALLRKLTLWARFGLTAGWGPTLATSRRAN